MKKLLFEDLGLLFFTALLLSLLLTPATVALAHRIGATDAPGERSVHVRIMPRMGGLGMAVALLASLTLFVDINPLMISFLLGTTVIVMTGITDDLFQIHPATKMAGQIIACLIFLLPSGLEISSAGDLFSLGSIDFPDIALYATLFCMVGIINAFNLSDGLDGLAAGLTMIMALFLAVLALQSQHWVVLSIIVALLGSIFGFLKFNTYPAKMFMGDTGSLMLGFVMACLIVLLLDFQGDLVILPISTLLIFAVPVSDTIVVMTRRVAQGKSPVSPDKTHLHHRLLGLGFSHALSVILIYLTVFYFGLLALALYKQPEWIQLLAGFVSCSIIYITISACEFFNLNVKSFSFLHNPPQELTSNLVHVVGKSLKWLRLVIILGLSLPLFFVVSAPKETHNLLLGTIVLLLFAYPWKEHVQRLNIVYGLFYLTGLTILYVWNTATYEHFTLPWYTLGFVIILSVLSMLKVRLKGHHEVFLTSGLEVILICFSWFVPYILLPILQVPETIMLAAKTSCLEAIPLFIAMKIVIRRHPDRNYSMVAAFLAILLLMLIVL